MAVGRSEGLDDDHAAAAARAGKRERRRLIEIGGIIGSILRSRRIGRFTAMPRVGRFRSEADIEPHSQSPSETTIEIRLVHLGVD